MKKATSLKQVNKAIQAKFPTVELVKDNGFFYIYSDDEEMGLKIAGLYTSTIPVNGITHQTVERWVQDVEALLNDEWRGVDTGTGDE